MPAAASARPGRPATAACRSTLRRTQSIGPGRVELGGHRVELAAVLVDHADRHQVDGAAVLDELAVVEEPHAAVSEARAARRPRSPELAAPACAGSRRAEADVRPWPALTLAAYGVDVLLAGQLHQLVHDLVGDRPLDEPVAGHALVAGEVQRLAEPHARARTQLREQPTGRLDLVGVDHGAPGSPARRPPAPAGPRRSCRGRAGRPASGCPRGRCRAACRRSQHPHAGVQRGLRGVARRRGRSAPGRRRRRTAA